MICSRFLLSLSAALSLCSAKVATPVMRGLAPEELAGPAHAEAAPEADRVATPATPLPLATFEKYVSTVSESVNSFVNSDFVADAKVTSKNLYNWIVNRDDKVEMGIIIAVLVVAVLSVLACIIKIISIVVSVACCPCRVIAKCCR